MSHFCTLNAVALDTSKHPIFIMNVPTVYLVIVGRVHQHLVLFYFQNMDPEAFMAFKNTVD